jgi:hypothetical protein
VKLVGVAMVRNEADILEAFVRHNLTVLDRMLVVDHASMDGTEQILASLVREGLPLVAMRDESQGYPLQAMIVTLARKAFAEEGADFVFPLDCDEFVKVRTRAALEEALAALPPEHHARMDWLTYVPAFEAGVSTLDAMRTAKRVAGERHGLTKTIVARSFVNHPAATIELGAHNVRVPDAQTIAPHVMLPASVAASAHVPIRSAQQYAAKTAIRWLAKLNMPPSLPGQSFQLRESFDYLRSGRPITPNHLATAAANYSVPPDRWLPVDAIPLVDDPFLAALELRYGHFGMTDPLALVLSFLEQALAARNGAR